MCGQRSVLFDNRTKNRHKKSNQVMELLKLIEDVVVSNGGKPYTNELFLEQKVGVSFLQYNMFPIGRVELLINTVRLFNRLKDMKRILRYCMKW